jgi:ABC-2 type transport system permease protein
MSFSNLQRDNLTVEFFKEIRRTLAFSYKNIIMTKRNFFTLFEMLFWPLVSLFSIGLMGYYLDITADKFAFIMIGAISLSVIQLAQLDVTYVLLFDVWSKSLKYTLATPASFYHMIIGSWLVGILRGFVAFLALSFFSILFFDFDLTKLFFLDLLIFLFGLFFAAMLIGMSACILMLVFGRRAEISAWTLTAIIMLICGIYYPVSVLPEPIRLIALSIPVTHFLEYFRSFYGFIPSFPNPLLIGFSQSAFYFLVFLLLSEWSLRRARKNGMIIKLSE